MPDPMLETNLREDSLANERRESEPKVTVSWGSFEVRVGPSVTPGVGWSETELEAALYYMTHHGMSLANVEPIELPTIDDAVAFVSRLMLTCELPEQWVDEATDAHIVSRA